MQPAYNPGEGVSSTEEDMPASGTEHNFRTFVEIKDTTHPTDESAEDEDEVTTDNALDDDAAFRTFQIPTTLTGQELRVFIQPVKDSSGEPSSLPFSIPEIEASNWLLYGNENGDREDPEPFVWPAEKRWLSGYNFSIAHPGIDIAAYWDDLIFAAASGKVVYTHYSNRGYGNMVMIDHLNGYRTLYAHLNTILAEMGSFVIQGQPIGLAGSTGNSTGTHLHFEIHYQGKFVNPWHFLNQ